MRYDAIAGYLAAPSDEDPRYRRDSLDEPADREPVGGLKRTLREPDPRDDTLGGLISRLGVFAPFDGAREELYFDAQRIGIRVEASEVEDDALYLVRYEGEDGETYGIVTAEEARALEDDGIDYEAYRLDPIPHDTIDEPQAGFYGYIAHFADRFVLNKGTADRPDTLADTAKHELGHYFTPNFFMGAEAYEQMNLAMTSTYATKEQPRGSTPARILPSFEDVYEPQLREQRVYR